MKLSCREVQHGLMWNSMKGPFNFAQRLEGEEALSAVLGLAC